MKLLLLAAALAGPSHAKDPRELAVYRDPQGTFSLAAPKAWTVQGNADKNVPIRVVEFVGSDTPQDEGELLGAVLKVIRMARKGVKPETLKPTDDLFARASAMKVKGWNAREFENMYDHEKAALHGGGRIAMRAAGFVIKTEQAYYIVEFRGERRQYDEYKWALEKARVTFKLLADGRAEQGSGEGAQQKPKRAEQKSQ